MGPKQLAEHFEKVELMAGVGSWRWEPGRRHLWWSPGMHAIFGISPSEFDNRQETLIEAAVPEDRHLLAEAAARYAQTGVPELLKYRIARPDGAIRHVWAFGETIEDDGQDVARGYVIDVSERVRTEADLRSRTEELLIEGEARFRSVVRMAPLPAMLHAEDGEVLEINGRWTELSGYSLADIPSIQAWTERAYPGRSEEVRDGIAKLFSLDDAQDEGDFAIRTSAGETREWLFSSVRLGALADGRRVVISLAQDITAERQMERERREYEARLHQAQKIESLGVLAGGIAHDFNNLLMGVIGTLGVALEGPADPKEMRMLLLQAQEAAGQAAALSRDMLTYAGKQSPERRSIRVDRRIEEMSGLLRASLSHHHELTLELRAEGAATVLGENQLGQVVMNLVSNAAAAATAGPGVICVRTGLEELDRDALALRYLGAAATPGRYVFVEVQDNGLGMEPDVARRIFEPFFSTRGSGRGLGMAVIIGIVRTAGGVAQVETAPGRGTRVRLAFPTVEHLSAKMLARPAPGAAGSKGNVRRSGAILLVDDEKLVRRTVRLMLKKLGYDVVTASGGAEAIDVAVASEAPIAAAIVDLTMPGRSGVDVLRDLKRWDPSLPVILATGYAASALPEVTAPARHDGFLSKPFDVETLRTTLGSVLGGDDLVGGSSSL